MRNLFFIISFLLIVACNNNTNPTLSNNDNTALPIDDTPKAPKSPKESELNNGIPYKLLKSDKDAEGSAVLLYEEKPFTGTAYTLFKDGSVYTIQAYENGYKEGKWAMYFSNGQEEKSGNTKNGLEDGIFYTWYKNGQLKYKQAYKNGEKIGQWLSWYTNGVKWTSRDFANNTLNGKVFVWDSLGVLGKEYTYENGIIKDKIMHFENQ